MSNTSAVIGALTPSGETGNKAKSVAFLLIIAVIVGIVIIGAVYGTKIFGNIFGSMDKVLQTLGLKDSPEKAQAKADEAAANSKANQQDSPFNPNYHNTIPAGTKMITSAFAKQLAQQIYGSVGVIYDDPEVGISAIKQLSNWAQVSYLSDMFYQLYGKDLIGWLNVKYDTTAQKQALTTMINYAFALPKLS
jgi:hypothetical protein